MDIKQQYTNLQKNRKHVQFKNISYDKYKKNYTEKFKPKLAIIVPFREEKNTKVRINHLKQFVNHMTLFFNKQNSMLIIEQLLQ